MAANGPLIQVTDLTKRYDALDSAQSIVVLQGVSLNVEQGESVAVVGPSGSGKSTLLHILGTLDRPTSGQVLLGGRDIGSLDDEQLAAVRNRDIGFVFQAHYLLPQCTVLENVLVPTLANQRATRVSGAVSSSSKEQFPKDEAKDARKEGVATPSSAVPEAGAESPAVRAQRLLSRVGLADRLAHRPGQLSGGERQRVAVVRALINRPRLLLADEPTGALDHTSAQRLAQLLVELNLEEQVTLILVTHSRELAARMQRVLELKDGRLSPGENLVPGSAPGVPR